MRIIALSTAALILTAGQPAQAQDYRQALIDGINYCQAQGLESLVCNKSLVRNSFEIIVFFRDVTWNMEEVAFVNPTDNQVSRAVEFSTWDAEDRYQFVSEYLDDLAASGQSLAAIEHIEPIEAFFIIDVSGPLVYEVFIESVEYVLNHDTVLSTSVRDDYTHQKELMEKIIELFDDEVALLWSMLGVEH